MIENTLNYRYGLLFLIKQYSQKVLGALLGIESSCYYVYFNDFFLASKPNNSELI